MEMLHEEWRPVQIDHGYEVSSHGNVRSLDRAVSCSNGVIRHRKGRSLVPSLNNYGYQHVNLSNRRIALVHRLVAEAFIENPEGLAEVNHKDCCKTNNSVGNLEWVSRRGNADHAKRNGLYLSGDRASWSKITNDQAVQAYEMRRRGMSFQDIGKAFSVSYTTIQRIASGKLFKHLGLAPLPFTRHAAANTNKD
jgi:hypothetical protein